MKWLSQMSAEELRLEIDRLQLEESRARRFGLTSEAEVLRQHRTFARSYLMDVSHIQPGALYEVEDHVDLPRRKYQRCHGMGQLGRRMGDRCDSDRSHPPTGGIN